MLQDWTLCRVRAAVRSPCVRFADLGCGIGDWTELLSQVAVDTYACDVSPQFVAATRARVPHAQVTCADLCSYALPGDLDLVYVGAVLMYLSDADTRALLRRIRAAMRPDAMVIVRDYGPINLGRPAVNESPGFFSVHRSPRMMERFAADAFLSCVERRTSPSIYGEVLARGTVAQWPLRALWRLGTAHWRRSSYTLVLRAS